MSCKLVHLRADLGGCACARPAGSNLSHLSVLDGGTGVNVQRTGVPEQVSCGGEGPPSASLTVAGLSAASVALTLAAVLVPVVPALAPGLLPPAVRRFAHRLLGLQARAQCARDDADGGGQPRDGGVTGEPR